MIDLVFNTQSLQCYMIFVTEFGITIFLGTNIKGQNKNKVAFRHYQATLVDRPGEFILRTYPAAFFFVFFSVEKS